ncbi:class I SAM-dependent methyltransferase [Acidithiobacillus sp. CV18-3]|nr:class I SAM-dependent methyltransferase [Acidithiobacillus sp. CV18-3]
MTDNFYRAFEDRYRGSRELIKSRLEVYLPFTIPLLKSYPSAGTIDLGCGRGEWLELLTQAGFKPIGIDLDQDMLESCLERGLHVEHGDAVAYLTDLPDQSQVVVSAFHVIEHIPFEALRIIVREAMRVLKPGGLLILETPNPENLIVGSCNFYLDPTHQKPIPPLQLEFLVEYEGFAKVKTLRLQESKELVSRSEVSLYEALHGASLDYAVVAQKNGNEEVIGLAKEAFDNDYGLPRDVLLNRWDERFNLILTKITKASDLVAQANERAGIAEAQAAQASERAGIAEAQAAQASERAGIAESRADQANQTTMEISQQFNAVINSRSWRLTKPLRLAGKFARWFVRGSKAWLTFAPGSRPRRVCRKALVWLMNKVRENPKLKTKSVIWLNKHPSLKQRLKRIAFAQPPAASDFLVTDIRTENISDLSPRARQIYLRLNAALEKVNKDSK